MNAARFEQDVRAEPDRLAQLLDVYGAARSPLADVPALAGRHVVLIGMGSSRFAALPAAARLRAAGIHAVAEYASTELATRPGPDVVAVGISASGGSPETLQALERHRGTSLTVAVTNDPASALAAAADVVLPLHAGTERGGVACCTFQSTVALLHLLAGVDPAALRPAVDAKAGLLARAGDWLDPLLELLAPAATVHTVAPAARISSSLQSALMLREGPRVPAAAAETGDWSHVDVYLTRNRDYRALLFGGSPYDAELLRWTAERASTVIAVGRDVPGSALHVPFDLAEDPIVASLVDVTVAELLAAHWWQARERDGTMP